MPNWLSNTMKVGGRIGLKVLCAQLGTNIGGICSEISMVVTFLMEQIVQMRMDSTSMME